MNSKRKRTKKKSGISRRHLLAALLCPAALSFAETSYAVVAGTVFRDNGLAFAGVPVELKPLVPSSKRKKQLTHTNTRGEFAFRVPAGEAEFELSVKTDGYRPELKRVKITGDERVDQNFLLDRLLKEK
ncbi:hypothetical protein [Bryobacter aggregatus]|uniref:hypothetical protein n=1 Tax=Bryobacter aggregatus TaxID=360054 RepID=UPI0012BB003E|nr:hypothetical protein [Bryobacter aggregatus]